MHDDTETIRRNMLATGQPARDAAQADDLMDTEAMSARYVALSFMAPFVVVRRKSDGATGTLEFTHSPRRYFNWQEDKR